MHSLPAGQTYCTSVVDVNMHSNIPVHNFTTRYETKEESKQAVGAAAPKTVQPAKCSASSSSQVKASDKESPTIVTPTITTRPSPSQNATETTARLGRAEQELHSSSDEATLSVDRVAKESKVKSPGKAEASTKTEDLDIGKEMPKAMRDPVGSEGEDRAGNSIHLVQVESAA